MTDPRPDPRHLILPAAMATAMPILAYQTMGSLALKVFLFAFVGGFLFYGATLWRTRIDARAILIPYLLTTAFFVLHVWEEYLTNFEGVVSILSGRLVTEEAFLSVAGFMAPVIWIAGAILITARNRLGDYFLCTFFFAMVFAELSHYAFPFAINGTMHYESGMYTAWLPLIPAYIGLRRMARLMRQAREASQIGASAN